MVSEQTFKVSNPRADSQARVGMISLPVPLAWTAPQSLGGLPTQVQPVGVWPESVSGEKEMVRRQLMYVVSDAALPDELEVGDHSNCPTAYAGPEVSCRVLSKKNVGIEFTEVNEAVFSFASKELSLRLGLKHAGQTRWWEWIRIEELWSGPLCKAVRIGGAVEVEHFGDEYCATLKGQLDSKAVHYHNWLRGDVYAVMFANGVIQLTLRHINNHLFDHGRDLTDVLPVVGFRTNDTTDIQEVLDGSDTRFDLGGVRFDLAEAATMVGPEHPGRLASEDGVIVYQPYETVEIHGDTHKRQRGDGLIVDGRDNIFPKGVARTVPVMVSMGEAQPVVSRFVAPDWLYGTSKEMWGDDVLPVHDAWDAVVDDCEAGALKAEENRLRCFDNAVLVREVWEGEIAYSQMLHFYRSGDLRFLDIALCDAYHNADISFDHATETIRMHNYPFGAIALPLFRTVSMTAAYLETGDPYLLECAESAAVRYYWLDKHNWPRRSYGRDAASLRSLVFLWDYTGKEDYLAMVREALGRLIQCQRDNGSYGDQGGSVGQCGGSANEITKVWMAMLANDPVVDYLQRRNDDEELWQAVLKTGELVLETQLVKDGAYYWAYEYAHGDNPGNPWEMLSDPENFSRFPTLSSTWGYKARFLTFLSARTGDMRYLTAWQKFHDTNWALDGRETVDKQGRTVKPFVDKPDVPAYTTNKAVQYVPYAQAHKWNAQLENGGIRIRPLLTDWQEKMTGEISTPMGRLQVSCAKEGDKTVITTASDADFEVMVELPGSRHPEKMSSNETKAISQRP